MAAAAVLLAGMVGEIEAAAGVVGHPVKQEAAVDVANREEALAAMVGIVQTAGVHRRRRAVAVAGTDPAVALLRPNVVAVVPSSWRPSAAPVKSAQASAATAVASRVVEEDVRPWTWEEEAVEECLQVESHQLVVVVAQVVEVDDPLVVQELMVVVAEVRPFRDA